MPARSIADRYELEQPLGGGAMSAVWLARDRELERKVAVKLLANDADRTRFEREAHAVAALSHPNICQLYDYGEAEDGPYMILEYLPGGTLEDRLAGDGPLPDDEVTRIAREIAAGLAHAHERSLVHRDLKPANILFDAEDRAKIGDFGIARIAGAGVLTQAGTVLGTAAYISPEQAAGEQATPASDVYSFGAILYRMLTGRTPFVSDSAMELVRMHRDEEPPPVERHRPDAPAALGALAYAALAKDPAERPRDGGALLTELTAGAGATTLLATAPTEAIGPSAAAPPTQVLPRAGRRRSGRRALLPLAVAAIALVAAAGVGAAYMLTDGGGSDSGTPSPTLKLPTVGTDSTSTAAPTTTAPATTAEETQSTSSTRRTSTEQTTTEQTTTRATSTRETTTAPTTTAVTTTIPATTTVPPTTTETTTDTTTTTATTAPSDTTATTTEGP